MSRALVLGGGGITGLAWEVGLVAGLVRGAVDLRGATDVLGTSAGSVVGTWIASGQDLERAAAAQAEPPRAEPGGVALPDPDRIARAFVRWSSIGTYSALDGQEVGAIAAAAEESQEGPWVDSISRQLETAEWPTALRVTAVDVASGQICIFDASGGVALGRAVAASCAVPGVFPPVSIGEARYMDGAVPTGTHAHRALERDTESVLVVAAFDHRTPGIGPLMERGLAAEEARLREAGARVTVIRPSNTAAAAIGPNAMDVSRRGAAVEAGLAQGQAEATADSLSDWR